MPKGKNAAALFEVMKKPDGARPVGKRSGFPTPGWFFNNRKTEPTPQAAQPAAPAPPAHSAQPAKSRPEPIPSDPESRAVKFDADRQEVSLKMSLTSAIVATVALVVAIMVAVIIGKQMGNAGPVAQLEKSDEIRNGPTNANALTPAVSGQGKGVGMDNDLNATPAAANDGGLGVMGAPPRPEQTTGTKATAPDTSGAVVPPASVKRESGFNYIIVQSYPEEADAKEVVELLARKGVSTTIERGAALRGYNKTWYTVMTEQGFARIKSPEFETMRKKIDQISVEQVQKDRKFKALTPQGYKY